MFGHLPTYHRGAGGTPYAQNYSMQFVSASSQYMTLPHLDIFNMTDYSIVWWVYWDGGAAPGARMFSEGTIASTGNFGNIGVGSAVGFELPGVNKQIGSSFFSPGVGAGWYLCGFAHGVASGSTRNITAYRGKPDGLSNTPFGTPDTYTQGSYGFDTTQIGALRYTGAYIQHAQVLFDEFMLFDKEISGTEFDEIFNGGVVFDYSTLSFAANIIDIFRFEEGSGSTATGINGTVATLVNSPTHSTNVP